MERCSAIILAGGLGTRIRKIHPDVPKPMIPVDGRPFMEWVIRHLAQHEVSRIIISSGYKGDQISDYFSKIDTGAELVFNREEERLGTGGAIEFCSHLTGDADNIMVLNGDSLVLVDAAQMLKEHRNNSADISIATITVDNPERFGGVADNEGWITEFEEKGGNNPQINGGFYIFRKKILEAFPKEKPLSLEKDIFPKFIKNGVKLWAHKSQAAFLDIGTPESLKLADDFIKNHLRPTLKID